MYYVENPVVRQIIKSLTVDKWCKIYEFKTKIGVLGKGVDLVS